MPRQKLDELLKPSKNGGLSEIIDRADSIGRLTEALCAALPPELRGSLVAANVKSGGELVVVATSPAFAARLRYEKDALIAAATDAGETAESLKVRVSRNP